MQNGLAIIPPVDELQAAAMAPYGKHPDHLPNRSGLYLTHSCSGPAPSLLQRTNALLYQGGTASGQQGGNADADPVLPVLARVAGVQAVYSPGQEPAWDQVMDMEKVGACVRSYLSLPRCALIILCPM